MGFKNVVIRFLKKTKHLKSPNFSFFKEKPLKIQILDTIKTEMPFGLISCVYSYAIVCTRR